MDRLKTKFKSPQDTAWLRSLAIGTASFIRRGKSKLNGHSVSGSYRSSHQMALEWAGNLDETARGPHGLPIVNLFVPE